MKQIKRLAVVLALLTTMLSVSAAEKPGTGLSATQVIGQGPDGQLIAPAWPQKRLPLSSVELAAYRQKSQEFQAMAQKQPAGANMDKTTIALIVIGVIVVVAVVASSGGGSGGGGGY